MSSARLNTVNKWWDADRHRRADAWAKLKVFVRDIPYCELNQEEKNIVFHFWWTGELPKIIE